MGSPSTSGNVLRSSLHSSRFCTEKYPQRSFLIRTMFGSEEPRRLAKVGRQLTKLAYSRCCDSEAPVHIAGK